MQKIFISFIIFVSTISVPLISHPSTKFQDSGNSLPYIDVVIPSADKDLDTLNLCIDGIRTHGAHIRRIIVVSAYPLTDKAEWFDEAEFPFDKYSVAYELNRHNIEDTLAYLSKKPCRVGWYFQQLLKLYAPFVIPDISPNVLILDSDTIFLKPVEFIDSSNCALYNTGIEYNIPYFEHFKWFLPCLSRLDENISGICHHMLFQLPILEDLFELVETFHEEELWVAFCRSVNPKDLPHSGASEYEIYFNFIFSKYQDQVRVRDLNWKNFSDIPELTQDTLQEFQESDLDYVSVHHFI